MKMQQRIHAALEEALRPVHLEVWNESGGHNVPPGSETHFKVLVVAPAFSGQARVARHRQVYAVLGEVLRGGVHALAIHAYTEAEWQRRGGSVPRSAPCAGAA